MPASSLASPGAVTARSERPVAVGCDDCRTQSSGTLPERHVELYRLPHRNMEHDWLECNTVKQASPSNNRCELLSKSIYPVYYYMNAPPS